MSTWELCQKRNSLHSFIHSKSLQLGNALKVYRGLLLAILFPFIPITAYWAPDNATSTAKTAEIHEVVWMAESDGLLAIDSADGTSGLEITQAAGAQVVAVDGVRRVIWTYAQTALSAYSFEGQTLAIIPITPPAGAYNGAPALALAVVPDDGSVWFAMHKVLVHYAVQGTLLATIPLTDQIQALSLDEKNSRLWVATTKTITSINLTDGAPGPAPNLGKNPVIKDIACDPEDGALWAALTDRVACYDDQAVLRLQLPITDVEKVATDGQRGVWLASKAGLIRLDAAGATLAQASYPNGFGALTALAVDPADATPWSASQKNLLHFTVSGQVLHTLEFGGQKLLNDIAIAGPASSITLSFVAPAGGALLNTAIPSLKLEVQDQDSDLLPDSLEILANGIPIETACAFDGMSFTCTPQGPLFEGTVILSATVQDGAGHISNTAQVQFIIDTIPPVIAITTPPDGTLTSQPQQTIQGTVSEPCQLTMNGQPVPVDANLAFATANTLSEGMNTFAFQALDAAGNPGQAVLTLTLDTTPPGPVNIYKIMFGSGDGQATLTGIPGCAEPNGTIFILNNRTGQTVTFPVNAEGAFSAALPAQNGDVLSLWSRDAAGNFGAPTDLTVSTGPVIPLDPSAVAPPIDPTVPTDIASGTEFLYAGPNPIQIGVTPGVIEPRRVAVLRGIVQSRDGQPLSGVEITIKDHPEYGFTLTRADGMFDMAANGGTSLIIQYSKEDYLPAQRTIQAPWQEFVWLPDVVLIPLDAQVTAIDLTAPGMKMAQGSPVTDADGSRRATLLFPEGTTAAMQFADETTQPLTTLTIRATEYTIGPNGPKAMPAQLPPTSAYTYCVELSADEAIQAGAKSVVFGQPIPFYLENFLNFPVGVIVPIGYYDYDMAAWIPAPNGKVVKILSILGGMASLDVSGNGTPATTSQLQALGISDAERARLAALYAAGQSLWRVPISHFTPKDMNFPYSPPIGLPSGAGGPTTPKPTSPGGQTEGSCTTGGSIIDIQNQNLGELMPLVGTPYALHYQSDRMPGKIAAYAMDVILSGGTVPAPLKRIDLAIEVAGQKHKYSYPPSINQQTRFVWDGKDAYGRSIQGAQIAKISVSYAYNAVYTRPQDIPLSFGATGLDPLGFNYTRMEMALSADFEINLGTFKPPSQDLGGFSISPRHIYDPISHTLFMGDGNRRIADEYIVTTVAGNGTTGYSGDGGPAINASFSGLRDFAFGSDGSIYIADGSNRRIRKISPNGIITTVAGTGQCAYSITDGIYAINANLCNPQGVDVGQDGSIYITDYEIKKVLKVLPSGILYAVAGNGQSGHPAEGAIATQTPIYNPENIEIDPNGGFYLAYMAGTESYIKKVGPDGRIRHIAGKWTTTPYFCGDGGPASQACLRWVDDLMLADDGSLFFAQAFNHRVRRITQDGIINTIAGSGHNTTGAFSGDGGPATLARLNQPYDVAFAADGSLLIADLNNNRIRRINQEGIVSSIAGNGSAIYNGEGNYASQTAIRPTAIKVGPDGYPYLLDNYNNRLRKLTRGFPGFSTDEFGIASQDGGEVYVFSRNGKHLRTLNALTGAVLHQFTYTSDGMLSQIQDTSGNLTRIERSADGKPAAIIGPEGQRTALTLNTDGYISSITNPANETVQFDYTPEGLMRHMIDAKEQSHVFVYNALGQLTSDTNPGNGATMLTREDTANGFSMERQTSEGRVSTYTTEMLSTGVQRRTVTDAGCNCSTEVLIEPSGLTTATKPDGTVTTSQEGPDPRFKMQTPLPQSIKVKTPSGLTSTTTTNRTAVLADPNDPLSIQSQTDTITINGKSYTSTYTAADRTYTLASPEGRQSTSTLDAKGRISTVQIPGLEPVSYSYDSKGRLGGIAQGVRSFSLTYDPQGYVDTIRDSLNRTVGFDYDGAGRVTKQYLPDTRQIAFAYDNNGNLTSLTPPGKPAHQFTYYNTDLQENYIPPDIGLRNGTTHYSYNLDKDITQIARPDGKIIGFSYDASGRLSSLTTPEGETNLTYNATTNQLETIASPDGESLTFNYDGPLDMGTMWAGAISGSVSRTYNADFRVTSTSVNGGNTIIYGYDNDGLLTSAGEMTLQRNTPNGLLTGTLMGTMTDAYSYNTYGEPVGYTATLPSGFTYSESYVRDNIGRITQKTEKIFDAQAVYDYTYDTAGRLTNVKKNNIAVEHYAYDSNGNRLTAQTVVGGSVAATYDAQDRLITYGGAEFTYTANGELLTKTENGKTTTYNYDVLGNLLSVALPDGTLIEYIVDGLNRRVGKKVNGALVQGFLYDGQLAPVAELDGSGAIVSRFVYATHINVPDYMIKGGTTYRIITDHLGSPRLVVNATDGSLLQQMEYDSFGNVLSDSNQGLQPFGFAGGLFDRDTALVRFGARDFDPKIGRWTSKDPISFDGGDSNLYSYVLNDPINWIDPMGLFELADLPTWVDAALEPMANFSAGFGNVVSLGLTNWINRQWQDKVWDHHGSIDYCSGLYTAGQWTGYAWWAAFNTTGYMTGHEFSTAGKNFRLAPWGNRAGNPIGRFPHYHRRIVGADGSTIPGGGIGWHRPWQQGW